MRVLIITPMLPSSKNPNSMAPLLDQLDSLRAIGYEFDILEIKGRAKLKYLYGLPELWRRAPAAELIHAHHGFCGWLARMQFIKPVVVSFMGEDLLGMPGTGPFLTICYRLLVWADCWLARWVDAVIVKSNEMAAALAPLPVHVIPNGVALAKFAPTDQAIARKTLGWTMGATYILFPANPSNMRKQYDLAKTVTDAAAKRLHRPLTLVPLAGIPHQHVATYMNACDVMLFTSRMEGSPNVIKEAMACNLPTVSTNVGDVAELFEGVPGYVVCDSNETNLIDALVHVLNQGKVGAKGVDAICQKQLDLPTVAAKLSGIYESLMQNDTFGR